LDLLGLIAGVPADMAQIPWDGPQVRIVEHQAHAPGHAALLISERGVLVAGDILSDVLIPMLDLNDTADPIEDYLAALRLLEGVAGDVDVLVPGRGSAHRPRTARIGFLACMNGNYSTSPEEESATARPDRDP